MTRAHKIILVILGIGILTLCGLTLSAAYQLWTQPLGPALNLPTRTYAPPSTLPPTWTPLAGAQQPTASPATGTPDPVSETPTPKQARCGGPDQMIILAVGSDQRGDSYLYGLGDVIRLVRVDFVTPLVTIMSLPRDLYVEIPGISDHYSITHGKLNQSYLYGNPGFGYYEGADLGPGLMARTLAHNFGAHPDHYIAVNMQTFIKIVDAVDGIVVDLPQAIDASNASDPANRSDLVFPAGINYLNGYKALQLARLRPYGVFGRVSAQNEVLCGLYDKLVSPNVVGDIPGIINAFRDNVQTDLSPEDISQLSCLGTQLKGADIVFLNWNEDTFTGTRVDDPVLGYTFIWDVDFNLMREYIAAFERGEWLAAASSTSSGSGDSAPKSFCD